MELESLDVSRIMPNSFNSDQVICMIFEMLKEIKEDMRDIKKALASHGVVLNTHPPIQSE